MKGLFCDVSTGVDGAYKKTIAFVTSPECGIVASMPLPGHKSKATSELCRLLDRQIYEYSSMPLLAFRIVFILMSQQALVITKAEHIKRFLGNRPAPVFYVATCPKHREGMVETIRGERVYHILLSPGHTVCQHDATLSERRELLEWLTRMAAAAAEIPGVVLPHVDEPVLPLSLEILRSFLSEITAHSCELLGSRLCNTNREVSDIDFTLRLPNETSFKGQDCCRELLAYVATACERFACKVERRLAPRVPLISLQVGSHTVEVTAYNHLGRRNSELFREYAKISPQFKRLTIAVKDWLAQLNFLGAFSGGISSYAVSILCLYYLMVRGSEPIPNLQEVNKEPSLWLFDTRGRGWRSNFRRAYTSEYSIEHSISTTSLMKRFFAYYGNFDWQHGVVQPALLRRGTHIDRLACKEYAESVTMTPMDSDMLENLLGSQPCICCPIEAGYNAIKYCIKFPDILRAFKSNTSSCYLQDVYGTKRDT